MTTMIEPIGNLPVVHSLRVLCRCPLVVAVVVDGLFVNCVGVRSWGDVDLW